MITKKLLLDSGYNEFQEPFRENDKPHYVASYQKLFNDSKGRKYSITIANWDLTDLMKRPGISFSASTQFNTHSTSKPTFDVKLLIEDDMTVGDIEAWFENTFNVMDADYYSRSEE
jgi:hypothetical protein